MKFDKELVLIIADYMRDTYKDDTAHVKLPAFLAGVQVGWTEGVSQSANYVHNWHTHMDSLHESHTKGLIQEIEHGILDIEFGDV